MMTSSTVLFKRHRSSQYIFPSCTFLFILMMSLCGCGQTKSDSASAAHKDSIPMIRLPQNAMILPEELNRLQHASNVWFDSILKRTGFNGAVLVAKGGTIVYEKYRGLALIGKPDSITPETPFHIASVSKTITGMVTLKLWQDGKIGLDDEYSKYFPTFNYPGVTIRTLLDHRSGLPNYLYFMEKLWPDKKVHVKNQDIYDYLVQKKGLMENVAKPDSRFSYCNTNFALLALLIEKVTGTPFPQYIQETIFTPLRMTNSFVYTPQDNARITPSYDVRGRIIPLMYLDDVYGDKNVYSTTHDLLKWDRGIASGLMFSAKTLEAAYTGYSNERAGIKNYGLGWRMNNFPNGKKMIFHNGWWHGNNAAFIRLQDEDATIIVVNNRYTSATYKAKFLVNIFGHYFDSPVEDDAENPVPPQAVKATPVKAGRKKAPVRAKVTARTGRKHR